MTSLRFWKLSGAGNDFVLLAGLPKGRGGPALARTLCDRRRGIGADGLLVVERGAKRPKLRYWNADGSAAFCGNGSRAGALWASWNGYAKGTAFSLDSNRGRLEIALTGKGRAEVTMPKISKLRLGMKVDGFTVHYVDTGVPHAVLFIHSDKVDVDSLGRRFRRHAAFGKAGANVNFVSAKDGRLFVRTYERGVEAETLACGTGVVASAVVANALGFAGPIIPVQVRSGDLLRVTLSGSSPRLEGPGRLVFSGEVML